MHAGPRALGNEATWESRRKLQPSISTDVDEAGREGVDWICTVRHGSVPFHHQSIREVLRSL